MAQCGWVKPGYVMVALHKAGVFSGCYSNNRTALAMKGATGFGGLFHGELALSPRPCSPLNVNQFLMTTSGDGNQQTECHR